MWAWGSMYLMGKAPNPKLQTPKKSQAPNSKSQKPGAPPRRLELGIWSFSGAWSLGFGASLSSRPRAHRAFAFRFRHRLRRRIAEREQDLFRLFLLPPAQLAERGAEGVHAEILPAVRALHAIEKRRQINQLAARVERA